MKKVKKSLKKSLHFKILCVTLINAFVVVKAPAG